MPVDNQAPKHFITESAPLIAVKQQVCIVWLR
jgi:hypothetical protein